ncbi:FecCD family ABC transporter permease [Endothiovibrio diazotrophicus]
MSRLLLPALALLALLLLLYALSAGSVTTGWRETLAVLAGGGDGIDRAVILELRLPRALSAFAAGALLALAGALMQVLLRNPLADPYVLGISGGAAAAALAVMLAGLGGAWIGIGAFAGALGSTLLVFSLARGRDGWTPTRLLLTGVVVASGWGALISFLLAVSPDRGLRGMLFWLMGDLSHAPSPWAALGVLAFGLLVATALGRPLNLLAHGGLQARVLGAEVGRLRVVLYLLASLLTAAAVTLAGSVGFVGLVVPHMVRLAGVRDHRLLAPAAALAGGALVTAADTLARTALAPRQLPVGVVTAFIGVPLFLWLLNRGGPGK